MKHKIIKEKISFKNIYYYIQGWYRYIIYFSWFKWLIRNHIQEQYEYRIIVMNKECYNSGSCIKCGCQTTMLQFANKSCDGNCYPKLISKKKWNKCKSTLYSNIITKKLKK